MFKKITAAKNDYGNLSVYLCYSCVFKLNWLSDATIKRLLDNSETKLKTKIYKTDFWIPIKLLSFNTGTMDAANQTMDCLFPAHTRTHTHTLMPQSSA